MTAPASAARSIASNRPPLTSADDLARDYANVATAIDEILKSAEGLPPVIEDDEDMAAIAAVVPRIRGAIKRAEELREAEKGPYLDAGRIVDAWFNAHKTRLNTLSAQLGGRLDSYTRKKEAAARAAREEEERRAREATEVQRKAAEAAAQAGKIDQEIEARERAAEAENEAQEAAKAAAAKPADLVRTHTDAGQTVSAQSVRVARIVDPAKIDLNAIRDHFASAAIEQAVNRAVKAGVTEIPGVEIQTTTRAIVR